MICEVCGSEYTQEDKACQFCLDGMKNEINNKIKRVNTDTPLIIVLIALIFLYY